MRKALAEPLTIFTTSDLLGVFLILLFGVVFAFIVAGINRFVLWAVALYRQVWCLHSALNCTVTTLVYCTVLVQCSFYCLQ